MSNTWQTPIVDRAQTDVDRVLELLGKIKFSNLTEDEQTEWNNGSKGTLNTSDLERIKNNTELLIEVLELTNTCSEIPSFPQADYYEEIRTNTAAIRNSIYHLSTTPAVPDAPLNTFQKWNDIEQILLDVYTLLFNNFYHYCNESFYCDDEVGLLI